MLRKNTAKLLLQGPGFY